MIAPKAPRRRAVRANPTRRPASRLAYCTQVPVPDGARAARRTFPEAGSTSTVRSRLPRAQARRRRAPLSLPPDSTSSTLQLPQADAACSCRAKESASTPASSKPVSAARFGRANHPGQRLRCRVDSRRQRPNRGDLPELHPRRHGWGQRDRDAKKTAFARQLPGAAQGVFRVERPVGPARAKSRPDRVDLRAACLHRRVQEQVVCRDRLRFAIVPTVDEPVHRGPGGGERG